MKKDMLLWIVQLLQALVWETIAVMKKKKTFQMPIVFENVHFKQAVIVPKKGITLAYEFPLLNAVYETSFYQVI